MASTWEVKSVTKNKVTTTTATYKNDAGKTVATITGLKSGLTESIVTSHIRVTEDEGGAAGTLTLDSSVLGTSKVALTLSNGGKYALALDELVNKVQIQNPALSYAVKTVSKKKVGTATVKGNLTAGYTLTNTKTITYSTAATGKTLATVSGLATDLETKDGVIVKKATEEGGESAAAEGEETATLTPVIQLGTDDNAGKILVTRDALTTKSATLKLDYAYSGYQLAFDGAAENFAPEISGEGTWTYNTSKNTATYADTVKTAGYALSSDGKTATYIAANATAKNLVTVSGVVKSDEGISILDETGNVNYPFKITLSKDALTSKNVTVSGTGYQLALADSGVLTEATAADTWSMNKTTATYKRIYQPYYTYDASTNKVTYHAPTDIRTYATISNVKSGLVVSSDGATLNTAGEESSAAISFDENNTNQINISKGALNAKKVTLKNGTDSEGKDYTYKLALNDVAAPDTESEAWKVSGTTATLTGKITMAGYALTDDNTITYAAKSSKAVTLATIKGLAKNLKLNSDKSAIGTNATVEGESTFVPGLSNSDGVITLSKNVLGTTNVALTSSSGFNYSLNLAEEGEAVTDDDEKETVLVVPQSATDRTFWEIGNATVLLKDGKEAYYTETDKNTITYNAPVPNATVATITGLSTKLKVNSDDTIDGITFNSTNAKQIILSKSALNGENVAITGSGGYTLALNPDDSLTPQNTVGWDIDSNIAYLKSYKSEGYTAASNGKTVTYSERVEDTSKAIPEVTGLKKGLTVKSDGTINGIVVGDYADKVDTTTGEVVTDDNGEPVQEFKANASGKIIQLSKSVLTTSDVQLSENSGYKFELASNVTQSTPTQTWTVGTGKKAGTVTYKVGTSKAGYSIADSGSTVAYTKKGTVTVTISGLNAEALEKDPESGLIDGLELQEDGKTIKVSSELVGTTGKVTISGGNYVLALGDGMTAPTISPGNWKITDKKNVGTATLYGVVEEDGYTLSADGKTINHVTIPESESGSVANSDGDDDGEEDTSSAVVLTTITGLKGGLTVSADGVNGITGIKADKTTKPTMFTLSSDVLGTSKVTISGGEYKLALDSGVLQEAESAEEWVTSGTTATYKKYNQGYYTPDSTGSSIAYTAATKGTTYATVKGIASGVDVNDNFNSSTKTLTLTSDKLGTSNVTLKGTGYKLALNSKVDTSAKNVEEWVTSGTTATFKNYSRGYYTKSSDTKITYTAATKGTTIATVKGIASGVDVNDGYNETSKVLTLSDAMLNKGKVTISGDGYSLALANDVTQATGGDTYWQTTKVKNKKGAVTSVTAAYNQTVSAGYAVASNSKSITYTKDSSTNTLATIKGLAEGVHLETVEDETSPYNGKNAATEIPGITVNNTTKTIRFDNVDLIESGKKATLTSTDYTLGVSSAEGVAASEEPESDIWTVDKKKGTAVRSVTINAGLDLATDAKSITHSAGGSKNLLTISGLNTTALKKLEYIENGNTIETIPGFTVDKDENLVELTSAAETYITKKATIGKNDGYTFAFDGITEPTAYSKPKWFTTTVKSTTTAALRDGVDAGYTLSEDEKTVTRTAEQVGDPVLTITGLKKGITVGTDKDGNQVVGIKDKNGNVTNGITYTSSKVSLNKDLFGKTTVTLDGAGYTFNPVQGIDPGDEYDWWTLKNGTATYAKKQNAGFALSDGNKSFVYTAAKSTTLATIKGLNKNYTGVDLNHSSAPIVIDGRNAIELGADLVSTSKITVTVPKNSTAYTLKLANGIPEQANQKTGWVTSGTATSYKDYYDAYYTVASNGKTITYTKPKDITVYATVKGIKSGATVTDTNKVITLDSPQLATSGVTLDKTGTKNGYSLALASGVPSVTGILAGEDPVPTWVTSGTTATYYPEYKHGAYNLNSKGAVIYTKATPGAGSATIKGAKAEITAATVESGGTFILSGNELNTKVSVLGGGGENGYAFSFSDYNNATIVGSAKEDTLSSNGTGLYFSPGKGNDVVTSSGENSTVLAGDGNDNVTASGANAVIDLGKGDDVVTVSGDESSISGGAGKDTIIVGVDGSGTGISVNAGAGDDSINASESAGGNVFIFAKDQGSDTITGFQANDAIQTTSGTPVITLDGSDAVITLGKDKITVEGAADLTTFIVNGKEVSLTSDDEGDERSANILLADDNYSSDAAQLSSIVQPFAATYTPYDFNTSLGLTKEDYTPEISFAKDDK